MMMDYQEAIEVLIGESGCVDLDTENRGYIEESEQKFMDACKVAISSMQELQQYKQLGTLEEVRKAMEKQDAIDPEDEEYCPLCHTFLKDDEGVPGYYCPNCGQAIHWKEWCEE